MNPTLYPFFTERLSRPRELSPQTERQLAANPHVEGVALDALFSNPDAHLQDYEVETLFGPLFPVTLADRADVSPLLREHAVDAHSRANLLQELVVAHLFTPVAFPDGAVRNLMVTEPVIDRYLKLHRIEVPLFQEVMEQLDMALGPERAAVAHALARERLLNLEERQRLFGRLVEFRAGQRPLEPADLVTTAAFLSEQQYLDPDSLVEAAAQAVDLAKEALDLAQAGRVYVSQSVAEHHGGHGFGEIDPVLVSHREGTWTRLAALQQDLQRWAEMP